MDKNAIKENILFPLIQKGHQAFFVGGCVRDQLLGKEPHDFDIVTSATPKEIHKTFNGILPFVDIKSEAFGIVVVNLLGDNVEIATLRTDKNCDGRHADVSFTTSIAEDASRRDLTINALFEDINGEILDPIGSGKDDLKKGLIRFIGNAKDRCMEDCLRILRAVRFASNMGFEIEQGNLFDIVEMLHNEAFLNMFQIRVSPERIGKEMRKLLCGKDAFKWTKFIAENFPSLFPNELFQLQSLPSHPKFHTSKDSLEHTWMVFEKMCSLSDELPCRVAALFHDLGKVSTQDEQCHAIRHEWESVKITKDFLMDNWKFTNEETDEVCDIIAEHMTMHQLMKFKKHKAFLFIHSHDFRKMLKMLQSDCVDSPEEITDFDRVMAINGLDIMMLTPLPEKLITGNDLISEGVQPCKEFGKGLKLAFELQLKWFVSVILNGNDKPLDKEHIVKQTVNCIRQWQKERVHN